VCLVALGAALAPVSPLGYALVAAPIWLHAGWVAAATIVAVNMCFVRLEFAPAQLLCTAFASLYLAAVAAVALAARTGPLALPAILALAWAAYMIRTKLRQKHAGDPSAAIQRDLLLPAEYQSDALREIYSTVYPALGLTAYICATLCASGPIVGAAAVAIAPLFRS